MSNIQRKTIQLLYFVLQGNKNKISTLKNDKTNYELHRLLFFYFSLTAVTVIHPLFNRENLFNQNIYFPTNDYYS
jgi:hypothetical protein